MFRLYFIFYQLIYPLILTLTLYFLSSTWYSNFAYFWSHIRNQQKTSYFLEISWYSLCYSNFIRFSLTNLSINFIILSFIDCLTQSVSYYVEFLHEVLTTDWIQHYSFFITKNHTNSYFPWLNFHECWAWLVFWQNLFAVYPRLKLWCWKDEVLLIMCSYN